MNRAAVLTALVVLAAGCSAEEPAADSGRIVLSPPSPGAGHTHAPGQEHAEGGPIGDGTTASAGGYRIDEVRLPEADGPGDLSFRILDRSGAVVTEYAEEQTKLIHVYVVRADLSAFRHLHPALDDDGTWRGRVDLGDAGRWRVIAELRPAAAERPIILGETVGAGAGAGRAVPRGAGAEVGDDGVVQVAVEDRAAVGGDGRLRVAVSTVDGRPVSLGSYLGAAAHLTGFAIDSGEVVHLHPLGAPETTPEGTVLTFHTSFDRPGDYRLFVQVRVDGLLHTVPVTTSVS